MTPTLLASLISGFLIGLIVALVLMRFWYGRKLLTQVTRKADSAESWASLLHQTLHQLKTREEIADSQRELAESRALQAEMFYRIVLESVPSGVATFDSNGKLITANPIAKRFLGSDDSPMPTLFVEPLQAALAGNTPPYAEADLTIADVCVPVGIRVSPLRGAGSVAGAVMVIEDLHELKRLQTRARLMEELADLGQIAAGIAHEFRNATAVLRTSAQFLSSKVNGEAAEAVKDLLGETDRLSRVTTDLLEFARPGEGTLESVEIDGVIHHVVEQMREVYPDTPFTVDLGCPERTVFGRGALIARLLDNLLRNAVEASEPASAPVAIRSERVSDGHTAWVHVSVLDRGRGLPEACEPNEFFRPFTSSKPHGTGIGLPLARKIARLHGGEITLQRRDGGGAVARLELPLSMDEKKTPSDRDRERYRHNSR
jgi:two-component system sensor histidine kinase HydH